MRLDNRMIDGMVVAAILTCGLAGCSASGTIMASRAKAYDSVSALSSDSAAIVVVTVIDQRPEKLTDEKQIPVTISTVTIEDTASNEALGSEVTSAATLAKGSTIQVRQMGGPDINGPVELLNVGDEYLLFLTPSMLPGDAAKQYWITGAEAGLYRASESSARSGTEDSYERVVVDSPDILPPTLTLADVSK